MYLSLGVKQFEKSSRIKLLSCLGHLDNFHNFINPKENSITFNILYNLVWLECWSFVFSSMSLDEFR